MTREEFAQLVGRIEQRHGTRPARLRRRVVALALVSYASLFVWLALAFVVAAPFFFFGVTATPGEGVWALFVIGGCIAAVGVATTVAVLRVKSGTDEGLALRRADAPALFTALDGLRARLGSAPVSRVVLSWSCNAGVRAVPRLGLLGWPRHHLELGLPLMEVLSPEEFNAVLAHEFAHISARHGRISGWIYRLRRSWMQAFAQMERRRGARRLSLHAPLLRFFDWFWPRFSAYAFVLSRQNEFEADAVAAGFHGQGAAASALLRIQLYDRLLSERFWPELWRGAAREPEPPADVFVRMRGALDAGAGEEERGKWLREAFTVFTSHEDTHPCLTERWRALGRPVAEGGAGEGFPPPADVSAAGYLFGEKLGWARAELAARWRESCLENWRTQGARARMFADQRTALETAAADRDVDALWDRARATHELAGAAQAEGLWRAVLALRPAHALANLQLGRHLLEAGDAAGEAFVERAMAADEGLFHAAGGILDAHYTRNGQAGRARELRARLDQHDARVRASKTERNSVTARDRFLPHGLAADELAGTVATLQGESQVAAAFLARKELAHFPDQRLFVLVIRLTRRWYALPSAAQSSVVVARLVPRIKLPGRLLVVGEQGGFAGVARKVKAVPGASFYCAGQVVG